MNELLDHYCERMAPGLWQEPFNLLSNLAFPVAAYLIYYHWRRVQPTTRATHWDISLLIGLCITIGVGSGLWHLLATRWALWADRIPILLFINVYLLSFLYRVFKLPIAMIIFLYILYHTFNSIVQIISSPFTLNGSLFYVPTFVFLLGITFRLYARHTNIYLTYAYATGVFFIALIFRTIDLRICNDFPVGSHFIWHILIAITVYILMIGLLKNSQSRVSR